MIGHGDARSITTSVSSPRCAISSRGDSVARLRAVVQDTRKGKRLGWPSRFWTGCAVSDVKGCLRQPSHRWARTKHGLPATYRPRVFGVGQDSPVHKRPHGALRGPGDDGALARWAPWCPLVSVTPATSMTSAGPIAPAGPLPSRRHRPAAWLDGCAMSISRCLRGCGELLCAEALDRPYPP